MPLKVWFITGTSRGFGREWAIAALERGDKVVATARKLDALRDSPRNIRLPCCLWSWMSRIAQQ